MMEEQYIIVRFNVLKNKYMNLREKLMYSYIEGFFDGDFHASNDYIGKVLGCTERTAQRTITSLKRRGLITSERIYDDSGNCIGRKIRIKKKL